MSFSKAQNKKSPEVRKTKKTSRVISFSISFSENPQKFTKQTSLKTIQNLWFYLGILFDPKPLDPLVANAKRTFVPDTRSL